MKTRATKKITQTIPNVFTFKCDEYEFTQEEFYKWTIARAISECNDIEKLHIIDRFIAGYLG